VSKPSVSPIEVASPAVTDDTLLPFSFPAVARKQVTAAFDGGRVTSDGGVSLLAAAERRLGISAKLAAEIADSRDPGRVVHLVPDILRARILAIACGWDDACGGAALARRQLGHSLLQGIDYTPECILKRGSRYPSKISLGPIIGMNHKAAEQSEGASCGTYISHAAGKCELDVRIRSENDDVRPFIRTPLQHRPRGWAAGFHTAPISAADCALPDRLPISEHPDPTDKGKYPLTTFKSVEELGVQLLAIGAVDDVKRCCRSMPPI
jgi:hypothetical protein